MKYLLVVLSFLFTAQMAQAWHPRPIPVELSDEALIADVEAIADELEANDHSQRVLNMAFNRSRVIRKKLNWFAPRLKRKKDATDEDIMPLLQDIVTLLDQFPHRFRTLKKVKRQLGKILTRLVEHREVPTEIAVLTIDGPDLLDFGSVLLLNPLSTILNVTNSGNGIATVTGETGMDGDFEFTGEEYPGTSGTCGAEILPGESCQIQIRFSPTELGPISDQLILEYFDGLSPQSVNKDLQGIGV